MILALLLGLTAQAEITPTWSFAGDRIQRYRNAEEAVDLGQRDTYSFAVQKEGVGLWLILKQTFRESWLGTDKVPASVGTQATVSKHPIFADGTWNLVPQPDEDVMDARFMRVLNALSKRPAEGKAEHQVIFGSGEAQADVLIRDISKSETHRKVSVLYREKGIRLSGEANVRISPRWVDSLKLSGSSVPIPGGSILTTYDVSYSAARPE